MLTLMDENIPYFPFLRSLSGEVAPAPHPMAGVLILVRNIISLNFVSPKLKKKHFISPKMSRNWVRVSQMKCFF